MEPWMEADRYSINEHERSIRDAISRIEELNKELEDQEDLMNEIELNILLIKSEIAELEDIING